MLLFPTEKKTLFFVFLAFMVTILFPELVHAKSYLTLRDTSILSTIDTLREPSIPFNYLHLSAFCFPVHGKVISPFGRRHRRAHTGTDIKLKLGDAVRAGFKGVVTKASRYYGYGNLVILNHGHGIETYYAHLSRCLVHVGDSVSEGTVIGLGGRTGRATTEHLHFELRVAGRPCNSQKYFDFEHLAVLSHDLHMRKVEDLHTVAVDHKVKKLKLQPSLEKGMFAKKSHKIRRGDTLYGIALKYHTTVEKICKLNNITPKTRLKLGRRIFVA
jgi:murein DD-endopeptidase MepM/ murein hydrolase activator NlpD